MQTIDLCDDICIEKIKKRYIYRNQHLIYLHQKNIAYKTQLFLDTVNIKNAGVKINIHKNIPVSRISRW